MKKTEKIEVRLSHEEKTALTNLAEQEGRSVSDLVRGLIERYMSINTTALPRKTPWVKFAAIAVAGFFAGHLMTYFIAKSHNEVPIYTLDINVDFNGVNFPLQPIDANIPDYVIPSPEGDVIIKTTIENETAPFPTVSVELCRQVVSEIESECRFMAYPKLQFNPVTQSSVSFKNDEDKSVSLFLNKKTPS